MPAQDPNKIIISIATTGASPAATFVFFSSDYKPPVQGRSIETDIVHNQNGVFKYVYDNGPNLRKWNPFRIQCRDVFKNQLAGAMATQQLANLLSIWNHVGVKRMRGMEGQVYNIHWSTSDLERDFVVKPYSVGDKLEYEVVVEFEEAT